MQGKLCGVTCGPGFPLMRLQALGAKPVSAAIPNAKNRNYAN
ncbi:hypothetical protein [Mucilaginibacter sp.]